nr:hypothetical protein [Tanacetum cinerariifolium]
MLAKLRTHPSQMAPSPPQMGHDSGTYPGDWAIDEASSAVGPQQRSHRQHALDLGYNLVKVVPAL